MQCVKIFTASQAAGLEMQINGWLAEAQPIVLFMTQSSTADETVITFYYDEPQPEPDATAFATTSRDAAPTDLAPEAELPF